MTNRVIQVILLLVLCPIVSASAQRSPQCETTLDYTSAVEELFDNFVNPNAQDIRQARGIVTQSASAFRGVLRDNSTCVHLRKAVSALLDTKNKNALDDDFDLAFFVFGDYVGVLATAKRKATDTVVVSGTAPLFVFDAKKLTFVAELRV